MNLISLISLAMKVSDLSLKVQMDLSGHERYLRAYLQ
jgi:hypothetical protein